VGAFSYRQRISIASAKPDSASHPRLGATGQIDFLNLPAAFLWKSLFS